MSRTRTMAAATALAAAMICSPAIAQTAWNGWYASFTGLYNVPRDSDATLDTEPLDATGDIELANNFGFALALGAQMNDALRVELEGAYRPLDVDGAKGVLLNTAPVDVGLSGDLDTWSLMVNAHYEMPLGAARPYLGAGLGIARHDGELTLSSPLLVPVLGTNSVRESGDDTVFAYQFMAGLGLEISENMTLFGGYRYMGTDDLEIEAFTSSYGTHAIEAGLRVGF